MQYLFDFEKDLFARFHERWFSCQVTNKHNNVKRNLLQEEWLQTNLCTRPAPEFSMTKNHQTGTCVFDPKKKT